MEAYCLREHFCPFLLTGSIFHLGKGCLGTDRTTPFTIGFGMLGSRIEEDKDADGGERRTGVTGDVEAEHCRVWA
jgi:hypothetical protein